MRLDVLGVWDDAAALVLSCPGPVWRHRASLLPIANLALPQVFLGGESQLLAFAAAIPELAPKMFFAPLPEMFSSAANLDPAWRAIGRPAHPVDRIAHLRFGSVRDARLLKGAQNAAILAEAASEPPAGVCHHPFASGQALPAGITHIHVYGPARARPRRVGGGELPASTLDDHFIGADIAAQAGAAKAGRTRATGGLDLAALADFQPDLWSAGQVPPCSGRTAEDRQASVLLPWNMAHFGSLVPALLERLATHHQQPEALPRLVLLPFNDAGQPGALRALAKQIRKAAPNADAILRRILVGRVTHLRGLARLARLSRLAWVDGNDPEHWWTLARLKIAGFDAILIDAGLPAPDAGQRITAEDTVWLEADAGLSWPARLPSHRQLHKLLAMKAGRAAPP